MAARKAPSKGAKTLEPRARPAPKPKLPVRAFESAVGFERWLRAHHEKSPGIWLRLMKKASGRKGVTYLEALDIALSFGWIDDQTKAHDADSWLRKFVPRGARSIWSKINRAKALALIAAGRMQPAGLAQVENAKKDGRWRAAAFFKTLNGANRYAVLFRVQAPKAGNARPKDPRASQHARARRKDSRLRFRCDAS